MRLVFTTLAFFALPALANFAMDPLRKPDPAFTAFFLQRIDSWLREHVSDYRKNMSAEDKSFVESFLRNSKALGEKVNGAFIRTYSFRVDVTDSNLYYGPLLLRRANPSRANVQDFSEILRRHGVKKAPDHLIGVGFYSDAQSIAAVTFDEQKMSILMYKSGRLDSTTDIDLNIKPDVRCPAAPITAQVDRVHGLNQKTSYAYHASAVEDAALSMPGRQLIHQIELGLQLEPGVIDFETQTKYALEYP